MFYENNDLYINSFDQVIKFDLSLLKDLLEIENEPIRIHHHLQKIVLEYHADQNIELQDLNALQQNANEWVTEVQKMVQVDWTGVDIKDYQSKASNYQDKLQKVIEKLKSNEFQTVFEILKQRKRFHNFQILETQVLDQLESVKKIHFVLKDFPIDQILQAENIQDLISAMDTCYKHLLRKLKLKFTLERWIIEQLDAEVTKRLKVLLADILCMDFPTFEAAAVKWTTLFECWDENYQDFITLVRDNSRKESQRFVPLRIDFQHSKFKIRLDFLHLFRKQHQEMIECLGSFEIVAAYEPFKSIYPFDDDLTAWNMTEAIYLEKIGNIEVERINSLKSELEKATTTNQMFATFKAHQKILSRPRIRGALIEYQIKLIESVYVEVVELNDLFLSSSKSCFQLAATRDIPEVSAKIMWAKNAEHKLQRLMGKVKDVVGSEWTSSLQAQKLFEQEQRLLNLVNTKAIFKAFVDKELKRPALSGNVFVISGSVKSPNIGVNFDFDRTESFKDVKALFDLGFNLPLSIQNNAKDAKRVYPYVVSLKNSLKLFVTACQSLENSRISVLCSATNMAVQKLLSDNILCKWESLLAMSYSDVKPKLVESLQQFVTKLCNEIELAKRVDSEICELVDALATCEFGFETMQRIINEIQGLV